MTASRVLSNQCRRDLKLAGRRWGQLINPLLFFVVVVSLFPLALTPEADTLRRFAPGILWVAALLAAMLAQATLLRGDLLDGTLEQMALSAQPLWLQMTGKMLAHWLTSGLPLTLLAPVAAYALALPPTAIVTLVVALLLGTPVLSAFGALGAALTVGVNQGGALLSVLVLPLVVPVLIFGARATDLAAQGDSPAGGLYWLASLCVLSVTLLPFAAAAAVRVSLD